MAESDSPPVITAPTGNIGRQVLDRVLAAGAPVRVIVRDAARLPDGVRDRVEAAYVGFTIPAAEALTRHQVRRVLDISALGRGSSTADRAGFVAASLAMDDLIASTGVALRAVTCPWFMVRRSTTAVGAGVIA